ncbi:MAG: hypothetical protein E3J86_11490 [Candidatus Thorarchaeota archaeon]|nr:MAG: hypothetical protein E3J86_11490 [Candidatus Thorarchaeota archaeon]
MPKKPDKTCFVIAPIGSEGSKSRKWSNEVLKLIIRPAVIDFGYKAIRADEIQETGNITSQVIKMCINSDLVIANLTDSNPNVFYEMAIRHAIGKPIIQIIQKSQTIPFDIKQERTLTYDKETPSSFFDCQNQLRAFLKHIEEGDINPDNPIARAIGLMSLEGSDNPLEKTISDIASMLQYLTGSINKIDERIQIVDLKIPPTESPFLTVSQAMDPTPYLNQISFCSRCHVMDVTGDYYDKPDASKDDVPIYLCNRCADIMRAEGDIV